MEHYEHKKHVIATLICYTKNMEIPLGFWNPRVIMMQYFLGFMTLGSRTLRDSAARPLCGRAAELRLLYGGWLSRG